MAQLLLNSWTSRRSEANTDCWWRRSHPASWFGLCTPGARRSPRCWSLSFFFFCHQESTTCDKQQPPSLSSPPPTAGHPAIWPSPTPSSSPAAPVRAYTRSLERSIYRHGAAAAAIAVMQSQEEGREHLTKRTNGGANANQDAK